MDAPSRREVERGEESPGMAHGLNVALLRQVHPDRIVVGDRTLFLREGMTCHHSLGTSLEVLYTEQKRAEAERITVVTPAR
jgi:hypothetical protein